MSHKVQFDFNEIDRRLSELHCYGYQAGQLWRDAVEGTKPENEWCKVLMPFLDALHGRLKDIANDFTAAFRQLEHGGKWSRDPADLPAFVKIEPQEQQQGLRMVD